MQKVELGRELAEAMSIPEGPQKATATALLLLLNAIHLVEPEPKQDLLLRSLRDGTMPEGELLGTLNRLPSHAGSMRSVGPGDKIKTTEQPRTAARQARTTLSAMAMLIQSERCALCERKAAERDELVMRYLKQTVGLRTYANLGKERSNWRGKFTGAGLFGEPAEMRAFVGAVLLAMLSREAESMIARPMDRGTIARFRAGTARMQARLREQVPDALIAGVLGSVFDFSLHSDTQVGATLKSLSGASLTPLFSQDTGYFAKITGDILPSGLLSGRRPPK